MPPSRTVQAIGWLTAATLILTACAGGGHASGVSPTASAKPTATSLPVGTSSPPPPRWTSPRPPVSVVGAGASASLHVLFIGNSYTYVNDLPALVRKLADASGTMPIAVDSVASGAARLTSQVQTTGAVDRIRQGGWTHVVLQGQSVEPLFEPAAFEVAAAELAVEARNVGAIPVFYETWARRAGDVVYRQPWSGGTPAAMQAGLRGEYAKVAAASSAALAPAGDAWEKALVELPAIGLFQADGSHPTIHGTYLVASVILARLTGHGPAGIADRPAEISAADATALQGVAAAVVRAQP